MRKLILCFAVLCFYSSFADAAKDCCAKCDSVPHSPSCTNSEICNCEDIVTTDKTYGIVTTQKGSFMVNCNTIATASCLHGIPTYSCASGFYGTATSSTAGCTKCPSNAKCAGGNFSTFVCIQGYYKKGSSCSRCPVFSGGTYGTTAGAGATAITDCYLPSGTGDRDSTGSFTYTADCYYSN